MGHIHQSYIASLTVIWSAAGLSVLVSQLSFGWGGYLQASANGALGHLAQSLLITQLCFTAMSVVL